MHIWVLVHPLQHLLPLREGWCPATQTALLPPSSWWLRRWGGEGLRRWLGVEAILSFSCCLCCPAGELKPCFSVSATEQQQNQYSKHCKRNTPSADVHGIFPNHFFFFPVWFNFDSVLSLSLLPPPPHPECCLCCSVSACVLASFCLCPCAAVGPDHSLTGFGVGVLSRAVVGCGDRSLPGLPRVPPLY